MSKQATVNLEVMDPSESVEWTPIAEGGSMVDCSGCGLDWLEARRGKVRAYAVDARGFGIWVRATCNSCGRVEIFECSGGDKAPLRREFRDLDRKHRDAKSLYDERQEKQ